MKKFICLFTIYTVFNLHVLAQTPNSSFSETQSYLFNYTITPIHYDQRLDINSGYFRDANSVFYKMPAAENFIQLQSLYKGTNRLKNNYEKVVQARVSYLSYEFLQNVGYYSFNNSTYYFEQRIVDEAFGLSVGVGLGKTYYLLKSKKLFLVPQLLGSFDVNIISKNLTRNYLYENYYSGTLNQLIIGAQLNLTVNYKINKEFGFSLSFERLGNLYHKNEFFPDDKSRDNSNFGFNLFQFPSQLFLGIVYTR